ncbi:hypothetical protein J3R82DRAFT_5261 [Butyriboletus roseoflavus]|nr:hypothetical protein J3R82DRAFT_5261 [Butyriboletus roseoflavus]
MNTDRIPGYFHGLALFRDDRELQSISEAVHRLVHRATAMDGVYYVLSSECFLSIHILTVLDASGTGKHRVGIGKGEYLVGELGEGTVELMKTVRWPIDPLNLFNPGKLHPKSNSVVWKKIYDAVVVNSDLTSISQTLSSTCGTWTPKTSVPPWNSSLP